MSKLPEEFAPTGPKLTRMPLRPGPPLKPRLFPDEARFALRLAFLAGGAELAAWVWLPRLALIGRSAAWGGAAFAAFRALRPLWSKLGTRAPRPAVAFALFFVALAGQGAALLGGLLSTGALVLGAGAAALPAVSDLAATCIADSVTVERRAAADGYLDMGQGLGLALGLSLGAAFPQLAPLIAAGALFVGGIGIPDLHDRGTPRSTWPLRLRVEAARTPLAAQLSLTALLGGAAALALSTRPMGLLALCPALTGMLLVARAEPLARNALVLPRTCAVLAATAVALRLAHLPSATVALLALGGLAGALPAAVARGSGELERPLVSSLLWSALSAAAGLALASALLA